MGIGKIDYVFPKILILPADNGVKASHKNRLYSHSIFVLAFQPWPAIPEVKTYIYSNLTPASLKTVPETVQSSRETEAAIVTSNLIWYS